MSITAPMNITHTHLGDPAGWKDVQVHLSALQGLWGGWVVLVSGKLEAIVQHVSPITMENRYRLAISADEFSALLDTCIKNDLLAIHSPHRPGHPDETMLQITLVNPSGETRTAEKWAGDTLESFDAVSRPLFALTTRTLDMTPDHTGPFHWPDSV